MDLKEKTKLNMIAEAVRDEESIEIDLLEVGKVLWAQAVKIVFFTLLGALILNLYSFILVTPQYESTAKLYVVSMSNDSIVNLEELNIGTSLTNDYEELILSYPVLDEVSDNLKLHMHYKDLAKLITLDNPSDTRVLRITAKTPNPELSMDIANETAKVTIKYVPDTMSANPPNLAQKARVEDEKVEPSYAKYTVIGALLGLILACLFFILRYLMDDTIRSAEDMEKEFGITPLTAIPRSDVIDVDQGDTDRKGRKQKKPKQRGKKE